MLQLKQQGVDAAYCVCVESSDLALSTAAKDAGVALKQILATGYDQQTLDDPAAVSSRSRPVFHDGHRSRSSWERHQPPRCWRP